MVVLDTNIIIDHLRLKESGKSYLRKLEEKFTKDLLAISIVTVQELYSGQGTKDLKREEYLLSTIGAIQILPYSYEISELAGKIARDSKNPIDFADATIAATTILNGAELCTLNNKHFVNISDLQILQI